MRHRYVLAGLLVFGLLGCKKPGAGKPEVAEPGNPATATDPAKPAAPTANRAEAKSLNVQGMKVYKTKDFRGAAEKFKAAIAADPSFPLPHYNLACVAALTNDTATARAELEWLAQSADPQARRTLMKAARDPDLKNLESDPQAQKILQWSGIFPGYRATFLDEATTDADKKRFTKVTNEPPDPCDDVYTIPRSVKGELAADRPGAETLIVSLAQGAVLFDAAGKVIAKGEAMAEDCTAGSQASLNRISAGQVVPDDDPEFLIFSSGGGHGDAFYDAVTILKRRGDKLEVLISGLMQSDAKDEFSLDSIGTIRHRESGEKVTFLKRWDAAKFALVATPVPAPPVEAAKPAEGGGTKGPSAKVEGSVYRVSGWTADGTFLVYETNDEIDASDEGEGPRLSVYFKAVHDVRTGLIQSYLESTEGQMKKAEKKEYAKYPDVAAYKAWIKDHPTKCIGGRTSPDGKATAEIKQTGKNTRGSWKKNKYQFREIENTTDAPDLDREIKLSMTITRDGKVTSTNKWDYKIDAVEGGTLTGDVQLCWSQDGQQVAWIIKREQSMMRDPGGTYLEIAKSSAAPAPAK